VTAPLRVELVLPSAAWGGAEAFVVSVLEHVGAAVEATVVALADGSAAAEARRLGYDVHVLPVGRTGPAVIGGALRLAVRWRTRRDLDVVLANGVKAAVVAVPAARLAGLPVVWAKHDFSFDGRLTRLLGRWATAVVAGSEDVGAAAGRPDLVVVHPGRPDAPLDIADARERLEAAGLPTTDRPVVACVGRLVTYKGFDTVIEALAHPDAAEWEAVVVGADDPTEPGERDRLAALADRLGVADRVHLLGPMAEAPRVLSGVAAVAVPTRVDARGRGREGWSMVVDEAMTAGVPVVVATGGAPARRVDGAGITVPPGDAAAVATALARLTDSDLRASLGRVGREQAASLPTAEDAARRFMSVLARAANRPGAGTGLSAGPPITVIVPACNEATTADASLREVIAQLRQGDEVVVVHDPSNDGTGAVLDRLADEVGPALQVVHRAPPATGIASARNAGVRSAAHDHIACTDIGCRPRPGWLDGLRRGFEAVPEPDLVTGLYEVGGTSPLDRAFALACYPRPDEARRAGPLARWYGRFLGRAYDPTLPTGRSMAFTREAWAAVGGFPEHLATAEDVGFGRAIAAQGRRCVLTADAVVSWEPRGSVGETLRMYYRYGTGDGRSGDRLLVGRNIARLAAYGLAPLLATVGGRSGRGLLGVAAAAYLSLPVCRARSAGASGAVYPLLPAALALKDVAKGIGCLGALRVHSRP
jgi:glycosyltransferase involved in cell wall biosynthesis/GT2 family glycosyltransferase